MRLLYIHKPTVPTEDALPPSSNKIYYNRGKGRGTTTAAEGWRNRFAAGINQELLNNLPMRIDKDGQYEVRLFFLMSEVTNKGWPKKAQRRFKKMDVDNRIKLTLDAISQGLGVDDRSNFVIQAYKAPVDTPQQEAVLALVLDIEDLSLEYMLTLFLMEHDGYMNHSEFDDILQLIGEP